MVCARTQGGRGGCRSARPDLLRTAQDWKARAPAATAEQEGEGVEGGHVQGAMILLHTFVSGT